MGLESLLNMHGRLAKTNAASFQTQVQPDLELAASETLTPPLLLLHTLPGPILFTRSCFPSPMRIEWEQKLGRRGEGDGCAVPSLCPVASWGPEPEGEARRMDTHRGGGQDVTRYAREEAIADAGSPSYMLACNLPPPAEVDEIDPGLCGGEMCCRLVAAMSAATQEATLIPAAARALPSISSRRFTSRHARGWRGRALSVHRRIADGRVGVDVGEFF